MTEQHTATQPTGRPGTGAAPHRAPLDAERVRALAGPGAPLGRVTVLDSTGSTNTDLAAAAAESPELSVLVTDYQAKGRGRLGRTWTAPPRSSLAVSILLKPDGVPAAALGWLSMLCALSLVEGLGELGAKAAIKWPNDVLLYPAGGAASTANATSGEAPAYGGAHVPAGEPKKLAGVLAQLVPGAARPGGGVAAPAVVVGAGINIDLTAAELPVPTATSLRLSGYPVSGTDVLLAYLPVVARRYRTFVEAYRAGGDGAAALRDAVVPHMATLGAPVRAEYPDGSTLEGTAVALGADGSLTIAGADQARHVIHAADVHHLRRADGRYA